MVLKIPDTQILFLSSYDLNLMRKRGHLVVCLFARGYVTLSVFLYKVFINTYKSFIILSKLGRRQKLYNAGGDFKSK